MQYPNRSWTYGLFFTFLCGFLFIQMPSTVHAQTGFQTLQMQYGRVVSAYSSQDYDLKREFQSRNLAYPPQEIFLRAFKKEGTLELWVRDWQQGYVKFKEYTVCASSGLLGPKRIKGDKQVPEGFYYINRFNPRSTYYLSLGINYPNESDRILGYNPIASLGGDIYIHGDCKTVGCLPLTNDKMEEVYWLSVLAKESGQYRIPVHIFPYKFNNLNFDQKERDKYKFNRKVLALWDNLQRGYEIFEYHKRVPIVYVTGNGYYDYR